MSEHVTVPQGARAERRAECRALGEHDWQRWDPKPGTVDVCGRCATVRTVSPGGRVTYHFVREECAT